MLLGIDIGGTKITVGLITTSGILRSPATYPTESRRGKAAVLRNIKTAIAKHLNRSVAAIGIGIAGQVDHSHGLFLGGPNLPKDFRDMRLAEILRREFRRPVKIDNDAHCFALAEALLGAGKKYKNVFGMTLGTGIGGGLVLNGRIMHGADGTSAEVGHMIIDLADSAGVRKGQGVLCRCGRRGHLEALASGRGMARRYEQLSGRTVDARGLEELYAAGDKRARNVVILAAHALAAGLTNILVAVNPDCIVLGGGLANFRRYVELALHQVPRLVPFAHLAQTPILRAKFGPRAGVVGAALLTKITNSKHQITNKFQCSKFQ